MWSFITHNVGDVFGEVNTLIHRWQSLQGILGLSIKAKNVYTLVHLLDISTVWEKEEGRGKRWVIQAFWQVDGAGEGRGGVATRLLIFPTECGLKPFTLSAVSMKCVKNKANWLWLVRLSWLEHHPVPKGFRFDSWSGHIPGWQDQSPIWAPLIPHLGACDPRARCVQEAINWWFSLALSLSLSLSLSLFPSR